jgi:uncharacterized membrane protein (UPF0136 family)
VRSQGIASHINFSRIQEKAMNSDLRVLLVMFGGCISIAALVTWACMSELDGSLWAIAVAFVAASVMVIASVAPLRSRSFRDEMPVQMSTVVNLFVALTDAGCWLFAYELPNSNWLLLFYFLPAAGAIIACKRLVK